jgi:transposase
MVENKIFRLQSKRYEDKRKRERDLRRARVKELFGQGIDNREIARMLCVSVKTINIDLKALEEESL